MARGFKDYFTFDEILSDLIKKRLAHKDVGMTLPPRSQWMRSGLRERKGQSAETIRRKSIRRTVMSCKRNGQLKLKPWGVKLSDLVDAIQSAVFSGTVAFQRPRIVDIPKGFKNGVLEKREVAIFDNLFDSIVLSRITAYVRDVLEDALSEHCYSFRRDRNITHQTAIENLQKWRSRFPIGSLVVAECDIRKFFDNIKHDAVCSCWDAMGLFDPLARKILTAYLGVYSFHEEEGRGIPQGGSFSTVLANLVLLTADSAVLDAASGDAFYARYCDDVIFASPDISACQNMMSAYARALARLDLPMHAVQPFVYSRQDGQKTTYYALKSKGPFHWRNPDPNEDNCAPWVSFLGCQIRYDGETRIREESIQKHVRSLGHETATRVKELNDGLLAGLGNDGIGKWFARFRNKLIAKGVGYVTAKVEDCGMCWAGAFPMVTNCAETKMQMRRLDRIREGMLCKVFNMLPIAFRKRHQRYKGRPFSYFGFLQKAIRPTNMVFRRNRHLLNYSDL